jgi:predicted ABC-type ATPase
MNPDLEENAKKWAKSHREKIAKEIMSSGFLSEKSPVSVFMAGSPGAGKTESSIRLLETFSSKVLRIDTDEYRKYFSHLGYTGDNSHIFQGAASLITEKVHDYALSHGLSFVFDGTFSKYEKAEDNIKRSLKKGRLIQILYVYQEPELAWEFTKKREEKEGKRILKDNFIKQFLHAREVVEKIKNTFGDSVKLDILVKDTNNKELAYYTNTKDIKSYIKKEYSLQELENLLQ